MSCFGIDLLGRAVPPPGYLTTTEQYCIHDIGQQPAPCNLVRFFFPLLGSSCASWDNGCFVCLFLQVQVISCTTLFKLFYQKAQGQTKPTWKAIPPGKKFKFKIPVDLMNFEAFQKAVANETVLQRWEDHRRCGWMRLFPSQLGSCYELKNLRIFFIENKLKSQIENTWNKIRTK